MWIWRATGGFAEKVFQLDGILISSTHCSKSLAVLAFQPFFQIFDQIHGIIVSLWIQILLMFTFSGEDVLFLATSFEMGWNLTTWVDYDWIPLYMPQGHLYIHTGKNENCHNVYRCVRFFRVWNPLRWRHVRCSRHGTFRFDRLEKLIVTSMKKMGKPKKSKKKAENVVSRWAPTSYKMGWNNLYPL